ncbi:MAG: hypothetical protein PVG53_07265 [Holophagae bacterium]|jgi:hypothetical protein
MTEPALIVLRTPAKRSLWDADLSALVERLEDELGVFVTSAGVDGKTPALRDAAVAARFAGCTRALVVTSEHEAAALGTLDGTPTSGVQVVLALTPTWHLDDVIRSYRSAQSREVCAA